MPVINHYKVDRYVCPGIKLRLAMALDTTEQMKQPCIVTKLEIDHSTNYNLVTNYNHSPSKVLTRLLQFQLQSYYKVVAILKQLLYGFIESSLNFY